MRFGFGMLKSEMTGWLQKVPAGTHNCSKPYNRTDENLFAAAATSPCRYYF
jgi:hypothetical protein